MKIASVMQPIIPLMPTMADTGELNMAGIR
jgi:hypothetical protein